MQTLKRIFFPFAKRYNLRNHAGHRLSVVVYWVLDMLTLANVYFALQTPQTNAYIYCQINNTSYGLSPDKVSQVCQALSPDTAFNFAVALVAMVLASYAMQLIYYKVILFVVLGDRAKENGTTS